MMLAAFPFSLTSAFEFTVAPAAPGPQFVRASVPLGSRKIDGLHQVLLTDGKLCLTAGARPVAPHLGKSGKTHVRRALISFPYVFKDLIPVNFKSDGAISDFQNIPVPVSMPSSVEVTQDRVSVRYSSGVNLEAQLLAPSMSRTFGDSGAASAPEVEIVEQTLFYRWRRWRFPDAAWPRIIEVREDANGTVVVVALVQRLAAQNGFAPLLAWDIHGDQPPDQLTSKSRSQSLENGEARHGFETGEPCELTFAGGLWKMQFPQAPLKLRGGVSARRADPGFQCVHTRCDGDDQVPMQPHSWQRVEFVVGPAAAASLRPTLESPHALTFPKSALSKTYGIANLDESRLPAEVAGLLKYHREAIRQSALVGHDWGNVTSFNHGSRTAGVFGMNRLNHNAPILEDYWRTGNRTLRDTALLWCENFMDLSIWWPPLTPSPPTDRRFGGTRYNNITAQDKVPPSTDFMWRSNDSVNFCTKGYDSFLMAFEETCDTRLLEALEWQLSYARDHVFANRGECRNIGDVRDFMRLYELTHDHEHLAQALRLFRELREKLSPDGLFDQGGKPLHANPPFIETDAAGLKVGFAKPYIIGYALAGLPALAVHFPEEPRLRQVVRAVADFLASSMDPAGGWRYPHPRSSSLLFGQALEHAWQIVQADRLLGPEARRLDAIEAVLRQRLHGWLRSGRILGGLGGFEIALGQVKSAKDLESLYASPEGRPQDQDYLHGSIGLGGAPPEGLVYLGEVLAHYLMHRPAERLLVPPDPGSPLGKILARLPP